jgi:hypothetical protein
MSEKEVAMKFYAVYGVNPVFDEFEIVGVFTKKEDAEEYAKALPVSSILQLPMHTIIDCLLQSRLQLASETIERLVRRHGD